MHRCSRLWWSEHTLPVLTTGLAVASLAYLPFSYAPGLSDVPSIIVPFVLSLVVGAFTFQLRERGYETTQIEQIGRFGWLGVVIASVVGGWWALSSVRRGASFVSVSDQLLTVLSVGLGAGVLLGSSTARQERVRPYEGHDRVLAEGTWTNYSGPNPVLVAVVEQLSELEGSDPMDVDTPLHDYIDPDVLEKLTARNDSQWQLRFYTDGYQIRVSGQGTVTVYDADSWADDRVVGDGRALR
ncbi:HalOD1 output domain-containing protein [Halobacterium zhouii]|uniref:HalOD1 output domain-containing protein n=1 Tax=Halobacterium zhouii TaxID=2902624 RepID=UPI001E5B0D7C|nr:HalOD1 output domain-containing protein [Halobacterium zhouii]